MKVIFPCKFGIIHSDNKLSIKAMKEKDSMRHFKQAFLLLWQELK